MWRWRERGGATTAKGRGVEQGLAKRCQWLLEGTDFGSFLVDVEGFSGVRVEIVYRYICLYSKYNIYNI